MTSLINPHQACAVAATTHTPSVRVYLCGPIAKSDWRHKLVPDLRDALSDHCNYRDMVRQNIAYELETITPGIVCNGPWFVSCDHGCGHGKNTHGVDGDQCCGDPSHYMDRRDVFCSALSRIEHAHAVFAYFDRREAYGSCVEICHAHMVGKPVFVGFPRRGRVRDDMWFPAQMGFGNPRGHVGKLSTLWDQFCQSLAVGAL